MWFRRQRFANRIIYFCTLIFLCFPAVKAASDTGDVDDWQNKRAAYAAFGFWIIFIATPEWPGLNNNEEFPIIGAWVWCMITIGFWCVAGVTQ